MEQDEFIDRVNIEQHRKFVISVQKEIKRKDDLKIFLKGVGMVVLSILFCQMIYTFTFLKTKDVINEKLQVEKSLVKKPLQKDMMVYSLEGAVSEIYQNNYKNAVSILSSLDESDHKDWYMGLALLGLGEYSLAGNFFNKISNSKTHTYKEEINLSFCSKVYLIQLKKYVEEENREELKIVTLSLHE